MFDMHFTQRSVTFNYIHNKNPSMKTYKRHLRRLLKSRKTGAKLAVLG